MATFIYFSKPYRQASLLKRSRADLVDIVLDQATVIDRLSRLVGRLEAPRASAPVWESSYSDDEKAALQQSLGHLPNLLTNIAQYLDACRMQAPGEWTDYDEELRLAVTASARASDEIVPGKDAEARFPFLAERDGD